MATEPVVTKVVGTLGGAEVRLDADLKRYFVRVGHSGYTHGIECEYEMSTHGRRTFATCRKQVKRSTPLFAKLEAIAKVALIKSVGTTSN